MWGGEIRGRKRTWQTGQVWLLRCDVVSWVVFTYDRIPGRDSKSTKKKAHWLRAEAEMVWSFLTFKKCSTEKAFFTNSRGIGRDRGRAARFAFPIEAAGQRMVWRMNRLMGRKGHPNEFDSEKVAVTKLRNRIQFGAVVLAASLQINRWSLWSETYY